MAEEAARAHGLEGPLPEPVVSMRTPYKVRRPAVEGLGRFWDGALPSAKMLLEYAGALFPANLTVPSCSTCKRTAPTPLLWQVHLNFPTIVTTEGRARRARKAVINRCRAELSGLPPLELLKDEVGTRQALLRAERELEALRIEEVRLRAITQDAAAGRDVSAALAEAAAAAGAAGAPGTAGADAGPAAGGGDAPAIEAAVARGVDPLLASLDWEAVVDVPHGSLRLPGSYKAPWMDKDPAWVEDKCYSVVEW